MIDLNESVDILKPYIPTNVKARVFILFNNKNIKTLGDLISKTEKDLLRISCCGNATVNSIKNALEQIGLSLKLEDGQKIFVYWGNRAENGLSIYNSVQEAQNDKFFWDYRELVIRGKEVII